MLPEINKKTEAKILELYRKGMTCNDIVLKLRISIIQVHSVVNSLISKKEKKKIFQLRHDNRLKCNKAKFIELQKKLKTDAAIAKKFGLTHQRIQQLRVIWGIKSTRTENIKRNKKILSLCKKGYSASEIEDKTEISKSTVYVVLRNAGLKIAKQIDSALIKRNMRIRDLHKKGLSNYSIAKKLGINAGAVYYELGKTL